MFQVTIGEHVGKKCARYTIEFKFAMKCIALYAKPSRTRLALGHLKGRMSSFV